jgi:putative glucoamylase/uncharacterized protein DUF3131
MPGRRELQGYARATWHCFVQLVVPSTGLPADYICRDLDPHSRAKYTSPTDIAMYMWATLAARDLEFISEAAALQRMRHVLASLSRLERHAPSGQFYNWYDPAALHKLSVWPEGHGTVYPFASSVDNAWLASALIMVANAMPALHAAAWALATSIDFRCYYDACAKGSGIGHGLLRGGFWRLADAPPGSEGWPRGDYSSMGEVVVYTAHHYGAFNTEPRIASYIAIALGQLPAEHYFAAWRTFPDSREGAWQEAKPVGQWRNYLGVDVFEGTYDYADKRLVPSWGGSMFEALMPTLVVPEEQWGMRSWAITHPLYVESQIEFGLKEAAYGYWGFSPASDPAGGYREYGVCAIGMAPDGYAADVARLTLLPAGWEGSGPTPPRAPLCSYGEGVVTPHASFLALDFAPQAALDNLAALRRDFPAIYGSGGFLDSVNVKTGQVADRYLALDQGMVLAAAANALLADRLQGYLAITLQAALEPLMQLEEFGAGRAPAERA